ncbi:MAG: MmcQ/YjbR family DNA-binding protein, partial [Acidimicrobiales bacterium]
LFAWTGSDYYARAMAGDDYEREEFQHEGTRALRERALEFPGVAEGDSCVKRSFKARTKGFLYLGESDDTYNAMLKVGDSLDDVRRFCAEQPDTRSVGETNWVTLHFAHDEAPPAALNDWIEESFRLLAPKKLVSELEAS